MSMVSLEFLKQFKKWGLKNNYNFGFYIEKEMEKNMNVIVIGGGPAGMMAAITSAENGNNVILLEKKERLGRKLLITGKGRCNITSSLPIEEFIQNIPGNGQFLYSAFKNYTNNDIINFLNEEGLDVKEERGNRIFPVQTNLWMF